MLWVYIEENARAPCNVAANMYHPRLDQEVRIKQMDASLQSGRRVVQ
jgi:hypothetical protein